MQRLENPFAPISAIYNQIEEDFYTASRYFRRNPQQGPPNVVVYRLAATRDVASIKAIRQSAEFFPNKPSPQDIDDIVEIISQGYGIAEYDGGFHSVFINRCGVRRSISQILAHEASHAAARALAPVTIPKADYPQMIGDMNGFIPDFGTRLQRLIVETEVDVMRVEPCELLAALGQAHILKARLKPGRERWSNYLKHTEHIHAAHFPSLLVGIQVRDPLVERVYSLVASLIQHLPEVAGDALLELYGFNAEAVLNTESKLLGVNGERVWKEYCMPLLMTGRLP